MQHAADQGLIGDTLLQGPRADCLEIAAGEADVDALILLARCPGRLTQRLDYPRGLAISLLHRVGWRGSVQASLSSSVWDDRFQEQMFSCFHVRHQVDIAFELNHQDPLAWIALLVRVLEHIQELTGFDGHHHRFKAELPFGDELDIAILCARCLHCGCFGLSQRRQGSRLDRFPLLLFRPLPLHHELVLNSNEN